MIGTYQHIQYLEEIIIAWSVVYPIASVESVLKRISLAI